MNRSIFIATGGTGGHINPARAIAGEIIKNNANQKVVVVADKKYQFYQNTTDKFINKIVFSSQLSKNLINKPFSLILAVILIFFGVLQSILLIIKYRPKLVVAFGGYTTFPILIASVLTRTKVILHEQNAHLGKVNRYFANYAEKIALSFFDTSGISPKNLTKTLLIGNFIRSEFENIGENIGENMGEKIGEKIGEQNLQEENNQKYFTILVIGGSGGAKIFSEILPEVFVNNLKNSEKCFKIIQQCRKEDSEVLIKKYSNYNVRFEVKSFFHDIDKKIKEADIVITRAGSSTLFELAIARKPMIIIPFAKSADNHQEKNAKIFEKNGLAIMVNEEDLKVDYFGDMLMKIIENRELLKKMSQSACGFIINDSKLKMIKLITEEFAN